MSRHAQANTFNPPLCQPPSTLDSHCRSTCSSLSSGLLHCISVMAGSSQLLRLQSILNAAAKLIFGCSRYSSLTPILKQLQWLSVPARIDYRLAIIASSCLGGAAPEYLKSELLFESQVAGRSRLRSSQTASLVMPLVRRPTLGGRLIVRSRCHPCLERSASPHSCSIQYLKL